MPIKATTRTFLQLIKALNDTNEYGRRHDYAFRASKGRTESTKELTEYETKAIVAELYEAFGLTGDAADIMRKKLISLAHQMNWELAGGRADMARINNWCIEKGPYKKALNQHDLKELGVLVGVYEKIYKEYMNKL